MVCVVLIFQVLNTEIFLQDQACTPEQMMCVQSIQFNSSMCIKSCNGLMINGYSKFLFDKNSREDTHKTDIAYTNYKKGFKFPHGIKGNYYHNKIV